MSAPHAMSGRLPGDGMSTGTARSCNPTAPPPRIFIYPLNYSLVQRPLRWRNVRTFAKWVEDSPFHEVDGDCADYFLVPSHPPGGDAQGGDAAVARLFDDIRTRWPYWNRTVERGIARHFWMLPGDHGPGDSGYSRPAFPNKYSGPRPRRRPGQDSFTTADGERVQQYVWRTWGSGWEALNPASPARLLFFLTYHGLPDGLTAPRGACLVCFQPGLDIRLPQPEHHECGPFCGLHQDGRGTAVPTVLQRALLAAHSVRGIAPKAQAAGAVQGTAAAKTRSGRKAATPSYTPPPTRRLSSGLGEWFVNQDSGWAGTRDTGWGGFVGASPGASAPPQPRQRSGSAAAPAGSTSLSVDGATGLVPRAASGRHDAAQSSHVPGEGLRGGHGEGRWRGNASASAGGPESGGMAVAMEWSPVGLSRFAWAPNAPGRALAAESEAVGGQRGGSSSRLHQRAGATSLPILQQPSRGGSGGALVLKRGVGGGRARAYKGHVRRGVTHGGGEHASARTGRGRGASPSSSSQSMDVARGVRAGHAGEHARAAGSHRRTADHIRRVMLGQAGVGAATGAQVEAAVEQAGLNLWTREQPSRNCTLYWAGTVRGHNNPVRSGAVAMFAQAAGECRVGCVPEIGRGLGCTKIGLGVWGGGMGGMGR